MYEDVEPIADLRIAEEIDRGAADMQAEVQMQLADLANRGLSNSGMAVRVRMDAQIKRVDRVCGAVSDIWVELIERKNGTITAEDVNFIMSKVEPSAAGLKHSPDTLLPGTHGSMTQYAAAEAERHAGRIVGGIRRKLEIRRRTQEAFPEKSTMSEQAREIYLSIKNSTVANLNLGSQVGTINNALEVISAGDKQQHEVAQALKQLTEVVMTSNSIADTQKREAVQALSTIALQAEAKPEERSTGTVRAIVTWLPAIFSVAADAITIWDKAGPVIKAYFGL